MVERARFVSDYCPLTIVRIDDGPSKEVIEGSVALKIPLRFLLIEEDHAANLDDPDFEREIGWQDIVPEEIVDAAVLGEDSVTFNGVLASTALFGVSSWHERHKGYVSYVQVNYYPESREGVVEVDVGD